MKFENVLKNVYIRLRKLIIKEYKNNEYDKMLLHISTAGNFMYTYNLIYVDRTLDNILQKLGMKYNNIKNYVADEEAVLLYDAFGMDNRGLSYIYVKALSELGYRIIYITHNKNKRDYERIEEIVKESGGSVYIITNPHTTNAIKKIFNIVEKERPKYSFMHTKPDDVSGIAAFSALGGTVERYQINLTDHAFWLGTKSFDYCIEFRDLGYAKSIMRRRINKDRLFIQPFYPANSPEKEFKGFPFDSTGKKVIYSGGSVYKIYGSDKYFNMVSYILDNFDDTIVYYTGNGDTTKLFDWIKAKGYEKRFYYEAERKDLDQVIKHCYFYLSTYPNAGVLMSQYAVKNGKIPVSFAFYGMDIKPPFIDNSYADRFIKDNYEDTIKLIDELLNNEYKLKELEENIKDLIISKSKFRVNLNRIIKEHRSDYMLNIDCNDCLDYKKMQLDRYENDYELLCKRLFSKDEMLKRKFADICLISLLKKKGMIKNAGN